MSPVSASSYDKNFQRQLLAHLRWEEDLLNVAVRLLDPDDFEIPVMKLTYMALRDYYNHYGKLPTPQDFDDTLIAAVRNVHDHLTFGINPEEYEALHNLQKYIVSMADPRHRNIERFFSEIGPYVSWLRSSRALGSLGTGVIRGAPEHRLVTTLIEIQEEVASKLSAGVTQRPYSENTGIMMTDADIELRISTGTPNIDEKIDGGLGIGELGMITACPGVGKTNTLINFGTGANFIGQHNLFVSLELQETLIKRRYTAIAGCILGSTIKKVFMKWPEEAKRRYRTLLDEEFAAYDRFTVSDKAGRIMTTAMVETEIKTWRANIARRWGDKEVERCTSVCIDWADLLHIRGDEKNMPEHLRMRKVMEELKAIATRHNVALWTATQGTKEADGKQVVHMRHVAYGYHKNDALDVGAGLALAATEQEREAINKQLENRGQAPPEIPDDGRMMVLNFNKNRNARLGLVNLYQAPTLRLYDSPEAYRQHNKQLTEAATPTEVFAATPRTVLRS